MVVMKRQQQQEGELRLDSLVSANSNSNGSKMLLKKQEQQQQVLRRVRRGTRRKLPASKSDPSPSPSPSSSSTRAEFHRLKTVLPAIAGKDGVSRLDIILEAIKYIDDLQVRLQTGESLSRIALLVLVGTLSDKN